MIPNRRTLFGLIAAPFAMAAIPAHAGAHPDAELLELERQRLIALAAYDRLSEEADALSERAWALIPSKPDALKVRGSDWFTLHSSEAGGFMDRATVQRWREALDNHARDPRHYDLIPAQRDRMLARGREILAAQDAHDAAKREAFNITGADRASELAEAACHVLGDLEDRILITRATTPEGFAIKARMAAHIMGEPDGTREDFAARAVLADLLAA